MSKPMHPDDMKELARRIAERAAARKIVQLSPETALTVAHVLNARATRPMRWKLVQAICHLPHCRNGRDPCIECVMKANAVEQLYRDEYWLITTGRADE